MDQFFHTQAVEHRALQPSRRAVPGEQAAASASRLVTAALPEQHPLSGRAGGGRGPGQSQTPRGTSRRHSARKSYWKAI